MAAKFLVKKSGVAARPSQYYPIELTKKRFNLCCKKIMGGRYFKWSIIQLQSPHDDDDGPVTLDDLGRSLKSLHLGDDSKLRDELAAPTDIARSDNADQSRGRLFQRREATLYPRSQNSQGPKAHQARNRQTLRQRF
jgi:hypothetical protein